MENNEEKIYCKKCGKELKYEQNFCNNCGTKNDFLNKEMLKAEKKKQRRKSFRIGLAIFLGLCVVISFFVLKEIKYDLKRETENSAKQITSYDCEAFTAKYNDLTDEKKEEFIEVHKGDLVEWTGYVSGVYSEYVSLTYNKNDVINDALCYYNLLDTIDFKKLNKGDKIKVQGIISKRNRVWFLTDTKLIQVY